MRLPRKGVLIRLCIYLPIIGFLGWRAYQARCDSEPAKIERDQAPTKSLPEGVKKRVVTFPDGTQHEIPELTQEQAEEMLGHPIEFGGAEADAKEPSEPEAKPAPEPDAKSDPNLRTGAEWR